MEPRFSIVIPIKQLNEYVNETVEALLEQSEQSWELFVVTNDAEVTRWPSERRISMMHSGRVGPADKRDMAAFISNGKYLVFLDDDSYPAPDYLSTAWSVLETNSFGAIGGPAITPSSDQFLQHVSGAVFLSRISGGAPERYRPIGSIREVNDWPSVNFVVDRKLFADVGGFKSPYWPGEDTFLCLKLVQTGAKIMYIPNLIVWHHRRAGLRSHLKQVAAYGIHRGYFMKRYPQTSRRLKYISPIGVLVANTLAVVAFAFAGSWATAFQVPLFIYMLLLFSGSLEIVPLVGLKVAVVSIPYVFLTHHVYAFNIVRGLCRQRALVSKLR